VNERTYKLEDIERARQEWDAGKFSDEWGEWRTLAQLGGIIFPPEGTRFDNWEDDEPSQRAILVRAIRETPGLLRKSLIGARSWGDVVHRLIKDRDDMREDATLRDRDDAWRRQDDPTPRHAFESIGQILRKFKDSIA
jgi:hypothetical protein